MRASFWNCNTLLEFYIFPRKSLHINEFYLCGIYLIEVFDNDIIFSIKFRRKYPWMVTKKPRAIIICNQHQIPRNSRWKCSASCFSSCKDYFCIILFIKENASFNSLNTFGLNYISKRLKETICSEKTFLDKRLKKQLK